ncbi:MAG: pentapeptide repeat-containing protein [Elusimicrobiota bacterium]
MPRAAFGAEASFRGKTFSKLDASAHAFDDLEFDSCVFQECAFPGAALKRWHLTDCRFENCDLTAARVTAARLRGVAFKNCRAGGVNWAGASSLDDLSFEHCVLDHGVFSNAKLPRFSAVDCRLREADFAEADLRSAVFTRSDLRGSRFFGADLSAADLRGAFDYLIDARQTKMKKTRVSLPEAVSLLSGLDVVLEDPGT